MPRPLIDPELVRIRDKYAGSRCLRDRWPEIKKLVAAGKSDEAEALIKSCIAANPRLQVRAKVITTALDLRREFLRDQRDLEGQVKAILARLSEDLVSILIGEAGSDGLISHGRLNRIQAEMRALVIAAWAEILALIKAAVRDAIKTSLSITMTSAQAGLDHGKTQEAAKAKMSVDSATYQTIYDRVKKRQLEKGLFANKYRGQYQSGTTLSRRVWDVRDKSVQTLRRTVASGVAQGRPASAIAADVKAQTLAGRVSKYMPNPGQGVYRSAYKNALRMVRTETNNAYVDAQLEYSIHKGYKVLWNLSPGHPEEDECDDLAGKEYDPESVPYPNHPNEACFLTTVLPQIG